MQAKDLMNAMLTSRKEADELAKQYGIGVAPELTADAASAEDAASSLPDTVIVKMLKRESLLTTAKLHALSFDSLQAKKQLESLKNQIRHVSVGPNSSRRTTVFDAGVLAAAPHLGHK